MRIGIFGGSFDPVHFGHLLLAECCREQGQLDEVRFLPAAIPPHKQQHELTPAQNRIEMLELAIGGHPSFSVSRYETDRGGVNYTVDTLARFREADPADEFFFLLGADMFRDLPSWRNPQRICELALPTVARRWGEPPLDFNALAGIASPQRLEEMRRHEIVMPEIGLCASALRRRVAAGQGIRYRTPRAVEKYIESQGLYKQAPTS
jgi:nicotinate-nucleotide adenylyltransferase